MWPQTPLLGQNELVLLKTSDTKYVRSVHVLDVCENLLCCSGPLSSVARKQKWYLHLSMPNKNVQPERERTALWREAFQINFLQGNVHVILRLKSEYGMPLLRIEPFGKCPQTKKEEGSLTVHHQLWNHYFLQNRLEKDKTLSERSKSQRKSLTSH